MHDVFLCMYRFIAQDNLVLLPIFNRIIIVPRYPTDGMVPS